MKDNDLVGFADPNMVSDNDEDNEIANIKKKISKKSGGFQCMALSFPVLKGILKRGYKIPTPIQRKVIKKHVYSISKYIIHFEITTFLIP